MQTGYRKISDIDDEEVLRRLVDSTHAGLHGGWNVTAAVSRVCLFSTLTYSWLGHCVMASREYFWRMMEGRLSPA
jgi:hypothetical protein